MDDLNKVLFASLTVIGIALGILLLFAIPDAVDQGVEAVIVDPSENERLLGMYEKLMAAK